MTTIDVAGVYRPARVRVHAPATTRAPASARARTTRLRLTVRGRRALAAVAAVPADVLEKIVAKIPVGRLGKADEIARGVMFLVSDDAGFVTGSTMSINGGQHMY